MDTIKIEHADLMWGKNLHPADRQGRVGKQGKKYHIYCYL
jgi:hypothetical protein